MIITKKKAAEEMQKYLKHKITLAELVNWAEQCMMEGEFNKKDTPLLKEVVGRIGLADVKTFGLLWEDCEDFLYHLGYKVKFNFSKVA